MWRSVSALSEKPETEHLKVHLGSNEGGNRDEGRPSKGGGGGVAQPPFRALKDISRDIFSETCISYVINIVIFPRNLMKFPAHKRLE